MLRKVLIAAILVLFAAFVGAQTLNTFSPGAPISSVDVNANFAALKNTIAALQAQVNSLQSIGTTDSSVASPSGYLHLNGGLVLQWGVGTASGAGHGTSTVITFPQAFAHGLLYGSAVPKFAVITMSTWNVIASTATTVTFQRANLNNQEVGITFSWFAVGY